MTCKPVDTDRYGRTVARCEVSGYDLSAAMVRSGWAIDYGRYSHGAFRRTKAEVKQSALGLWGGSFVKPWEWRHSRR